MSSLQVTLLLLHSFSLSFKHRLHFRDTLIIFPSQNQCVMISPSTIKCHVLLDLLSANIIRSVKVFRIIFLVENYLINQNYGNSSVHFLGGLSLHLNHLIA